MYILDLSRTKERKVYFDVQACMEPCSLPRQVEFLWVVGDKTEQMESKHAKSVWWNSEVAISVSKNTPAFSVMFFVQFKHWSLELVINYIFLRHSAGPGTQDWRLKTERSSPTRGETKAPRGPRHSASDISEGVKSRQGLVDCTKKSHFAEEAHFNCFSSFISFKLLNASPYHPTSLQV